MLLGMFCPCLLRLELQAGYPAYIYVGSGDLNSGPHSCVASALIMESSPQPQIGIFNKLMSSDASDVCKEDSLDFVALIHFCNINDLVTTDFSYQ